MLDIKFIRNNLELVKIAIQKKCLSVDLDNLVTCDNQRLKLLSIIEDLRSQQNKISKQISFISDFNERQQFIIHASDLKEKLQEYEKELLIVLRECQILMLQIPNIPDVSVPEGKTDADNLEIRKIGQNKTKIELGFTPQDHVTLMEKQNWLDLERGTKTSGFRGYYLKGDMALLEMALWQYSFKKLTEKGFEPLIVPSLVKKESLLGTGYLPQGQDDLYHDIDGEYFSGTAEVAVMNYYAGEILSEKDLPKKFVAFSSCFRKEAGAHGKDVKGLIRVHEFFKIEQVILCTADHEQSVRFHEEVTNLSEEILQELNLPYRVVINCAGDLGLGQVKKYDLEVWLPSQERYLETHSASYFHDFQTRRLNIRYRDANNNLKFAHSINNTVMATPRMLVVIVENYQNSDGTINVPEVLIPFLGKTVLGQK